MQKGEEIKTYKKNELKKLLTQWAQNSETMPEHAEIKYMTPCVGYELTNSFMLKSVTIIDGIINLTASLWGQLYSFIYIENDDHERYPTRRRVLSIKH